MLRVMRAQKLLSPHRGRQGEMKAHEGTIVASVPDVMWGTDGVRVFTADDGWVWTFAAIDHWNAECAGWHVCKVGNHLFPRRQGHLAGPRLCQHQELKRILGGDLRLGGSPGCESVGDRTVE